MRKVRFSSGHEIYVHDHRAVKHDFSTWESCFINVLMSRVQPGDVVFDVGAEEGEFSALVASVVGGGNVHMFEPSPWYWPNIKGVWEANGLASPGGCFAGFAGTDELARGDSSAPGLTWPDEANGPVCKESGFCFIHERPDIPATSIYRWAHFTGISPSIVMMDVEGAELLVLRGMGPLLRDRVPNYIFVSVHSAEVLAGYNSTHKNLFDFMSRCGYSATLLGVDHEEHWMFTR